MPAPTLRRRARRASALPIAAFLAAAALLTLAIGAAVIEHGRQGETLDRALATESREQTRTLEAYFARARSLTLITAQNPAFEEYYTGAGSPADQRASKQKSVREANQALAYLEDLFPGSIGEACFIDATGPEIARAVKGDIAPPSDLSPDEGAAPFFEPSFALRAGQVYQAEPYLSPDTHEWVIANATPIPTSDATKPAIVHFEVTMESFREQAADTSDRFDIAIVEAKTGKVVVDSSHPQPPGDESKLGRPSDRRFASFASTAGRSFDKGTMSAGGRPAFFRRVSRGPHNANEWVVVTSVHEAPAGVFSQFGLAELAMGGLALLLLSFAILSFRRSQSELHHAALSDPLTALGNRRSLMEDLDVRLAAAGPDRALLLVLFDLDGFKAYNDTFGHPAGDGLLQRLGGKLADSMEDDAHAYRIGGDEFCVLADVSSEDAEAFATRAVDALTEQGEGFHITASYGAVNLPAESGDPAEALRVADQRMYARKNMGRASAGRQSTDVLLKVLAEQDPELGAHLNGVAELCEAVGRRLSLGDEELAPLLQAATLHDVGKAAIPEAILTKPAKLTEEEWAFMRQHTLIGERILGVAPALARAARIVRSSHERVDGNGYPDKLAGDEIPRGSRIVAVCDAYDAMVSKRPYRQPMSQEVALAELRSCAGSQFDPDVVEAFCATVTERALLHH
jgi:diguanylate cyclase (GGDEF)-like protein